MRSFNFDKLREVSHWQEPIVGRESKESLAKLQ